MQAIYVGYTTTHCTKDKKIEQSLNDIVQLRGGREGEGEPGTGWRSAVLQYIMYSWPWMNKFTHIHVYHITIPHTTYLSPQSLHTLIPHAHQNNPIYHHNLYIHTHTHNNYYTKGLYMWTPKPWLDYTRKANQWQQFKLRIKLLGSCSQEA